MRVTAEVKAKTEQAIRGAARRLFCAEGFDATSTRDIAREAGVAAGTIFNYFPSKEALAASLVSERLDAALADRVRRRHGHESLAEDLFLHLITQLHRLDDITPVVIGALPALLADPDVAPAHLDVAADIFNSHGHTPASIDAGVALYRLMHPGILAQWARDTSPGREDSLAALDHLTRMLASHDWAAGAAPALEDTP